MNKELFLKELSERLQVLNEKERQDLLEEYAQHIDMKIANGLSEEDAVNDFGSIEELCAELLDVYHIDSAFAAGKTAQSLQEERQHTDSSLMGKAGEVWKKVIGSGQNTEKSGDVQANFEDTDDKDDKDYKKRLLKIMKSPKVSEVKTEEQIVQEQELKRQKKEESIAKAEERRERYAAKKEEMKQKHLERKEARKEKWNKWKASYEQKRLERAERRIRSGGSLLSRMCRGTWWLMVFLTVLCWKCCLFCAAAPIIFVSLFALFCTGAVGVLLREGYPLIGITLICLGTFLASAGLSGLLMSYVFGKKKGVVKHEEIQN